MSPKIETYLGGASYRNFTKMRTHVDEGGRGSYFRGFCVDVINVCSLTLPYNEGNECCFLSRFVDIVIIHS